MVNFLMDRLRPVASPFVMQCALLGYTILFAAFLYLFLRVPQAATVDPKPARSGVNAVLILTIVFQLMSAAVFVYASHYHVYVRAGYKLYPVPTAIVYGSCIAGLCWLIFRRVEPSGRTIMLFALAANAAVMILSIYSFPISDIRSDMLPAINAAEGYLVHGQAPYGFHVLPDEVNPFSYLPGVLFSYVVPYLLHLDLRWATLAYLFGLAVVLYRVLEPPYRQLGAALIALFLLCPYLQYRHDIYLQANWFFLILGLVLFMRGRYFWAAAVFGFTMSTSQLCWVVYPFLVLYHFRRQGLQRALQGLAVGLAVFAAVVGPFAVWCPKMLIYGTITQFDTEGLSRNQMNLSMWVNPWVAVNHLKFLQMVLLVGIFGYCFFARRCSTFVDCLRWIVFALFWFIMFNPLVDDYFYLMLSLIWLLLTFAANGWTSLDRLAPAPAAA
jgi:hypothetical protein